MGGSRARGGCAVVVWDAGQLLLFVVVIFLSCGGLGTDLVLDGLVAAGWGQVLSHLLFGEGCLREMLGDYDRW